MMRILRRLALTTAAVVLGALALSAVPAGASVGYQNLCPALATAFCVPGASSPDYGLAVDNSSGSSSGDVWVASGLENEEAEATLVKFDASGNLLAVVNDENIPGSAEPVFAGRALGGDAVDPTNGDVYVATRRPGAITKFDSSGVFQFQITETPQGSIVPFGVAVAPNGDLYVTDNSHTVVDRFTSAGAYLGSFPSSGAYSDVAVGPEGNVYLSGAEIKEYTPTGAPVNCPSGHSLGGGPLAIDPSDGHIFTVAGDISDGTFIAEYSSLCAAAASAKIGAGEYGQGGVGYGVGVNGTTHEVYTTDWGVGFGLVFGQVTLPDVVTGVPATGVTRTSATVSGTVNPDETSVTTCEVEYGVTVEYGESVPCAQTLPLEGNSPLPVSAEIKVLVPPASLIHYRLRAGNANGSNVGEDQTFYIESLPPPVVGGLPASSVTQFSATLNGTIETFEALVNYRFEYGTTTAYGSIAPIPDNYTPITNATVPVSQPIQGLEAGTTYHYRLLASSPGATEVKGPDETFTTLPVPAPTVATGAASGVGVGSATLPGTIDPHGWDTTYLFQYGTSTAYGSSWPTVQVDMGALEGSQPVVVKVPNLLPGTTYHYRLVASNGGGTSYGADGTFTTGEYPAQVIQEPPALNTFLVPSGPGKVTKAASKKKGKKAKGRKRHAKSKRKAHRKKKG